MLYLYRETSTAVEPARSCAMVDREAYLVFSAPLESDQSLQRFGMMVLWCGEQAKADNLNRKPRGNTGRGGTSHHPPTFIFEHR